MNKTIFKAVAGTAMAITFAITGSASAEEVIDPKVTCLFGEDWESQKITLGDHVDEFDAMFGEYDTGEGFFGPSYHIEDCVTVSLNVEDTGQVSEITVFPFNTATNRDSTPDENDPRIFTYDQTETVFNNFMPDDSLVTEECAYHYGHEDTGFIIDVQVIGYSEELYNKVLPETYASADSENPIQGSYSVTWNEDADVDEDDPRKVEVVSVALESWETDC